MATSPPELRGLALWHDRNRNGVSQRGEVRPVTAWGIAALSTAYDFDATHPHEIPWSSAGVRFVDGTVRPTFDVVVRRRSGRVNVLFTQGRSRPTGEQTA